MKTILMAASVAGLFALAACGGKGDDALAENVEAAADAKADNLDAMADNATTEAGQESLETQADATRAAGDAKADAIDDADVNADAMTPAQKEAIVNGN